VRHFWPRGLFSLLLCSALFYPFTNSYAETVAGRLKQYGSSARERLRPYFERAGVEYPPSRLVIAALKEEKKLELYVSGREGGLRPLRSYPVLAASGNLGPKLKQGDYQVPEGIYKLDSLNPNSRFHLSMRVNYPNAHDHRRAREAGRSNLGGDIMIHGSFVSIGCIAIGDPAIEEVFVLVAETGLRNVEVVIAPLDFRNGTKPEVLAKEVAPELPWLPELYQEVSRRMARLPRT
jgi:hypothetical protein